MIDKSREQEILRALSSPRSREAGFEALMRLYERPLYWHIRRMVVSHEDAEDTLQECFVKVFRHFEGFKGESSLTTWIYRIATNEIIRHYRRKRLETASYDENSRLVEMLRSDSTIDFGTMEAKLQQAILALPDRQRMIFSLRYYDELSYEQIAHITESKVGALKSSYHYAMTKIKEYMLNQMEDLG